MSDINFTTQNTILHHGILGQKWGVQNGPPYPLNRQENPMLKNWVGYPDTRDERARQWVNVTKNSEGKWVPTASLYASQTPKKEDKGYSTSKMLTINPALTEVYKKIRAYGYSKKTMDEYHDVGMNCTKCSAVMALKIMGYKGPDMRAGRAIQGGGYETEIYKNWFNKSKVYKSDYKEQKWDVVKNTESLVKLYSNLDKMPAGSFGILSVKCRYGGHALNYVKQDKNKILLVDSQQQIVVECENGKDFYSKLERYMGSGIYARNAAIVDLTNSSPNFDSMSANSVIGSSGKQSYAKAKAGLKRTTVTDYLGSGEDYNLVEADLSQGIDDKHVKTVKTTSKLKVK